MMMGLSASGADRLVVDVVELQRRTGTRRDVSALLVLPDLKVGERCVLDGRLDVDLVVEAATEGIVAVGTVRGESRMPCRRCLEDVVEPLEVEMREIFERHPTEGETWPIEDERIDLAPVVRELALLGLPLAPVCREDCVGPEPDRFPAMAHVEPVEDAPTPRDERWAALDGLTFDG
ncbi:MAG TPA: hypothetical protein DCE75_08135 [Acidimicrobiaceae bacterium]|nr:hypothetical protein [Acidimicrobiaceae bacterium]